MKAFLPWLATGSAVVVLCGWKFFTCRPGLSSAGDYPGRTVADAVMAAPVVSSLSRSEGPSLQVLSVRPSVADDALRQLEQEVIRATQIDDETERDGVLIAACVHWAEFDPIDALRIARVLALDQVTHAVSEDIIQQWASRDFASALACAKGEAAGEPRDHLMARLAFVCAQTEPSVAARLVVEQIPAGSIQTEAGLSVLHQWALRDFGAALAWVNSFPDEMRDRGRAELTAVARYRLASSEAR